MRSQTRIFRNGDTALSHRPMAELNITPLIDVLLVLLVMLMLSIPLATHKVEVELPGNPKAVGETVINQLRLDAAGTTYWNGVPMDSDRLRKRLELMAMDPAQPQLHFRTEANARYERFDEVIAMIKRAGVTKIGFAGNKQFAQWERRK